jgi:hypothetical protein
LTFLFSSDFWQAKAPWCKHLPSKPMGSCYAWGLFSFSPHLDFCTHVGGVDLKRWTVQSERQFKVLTIWVNHCSLANEKQSFPATYVRWGWSGALRKCNKYDLTATQCFWLAHHNDWSRWFVISSPSPICCPSFSFIGGVAKEYGTKLGCEKYFLRVTYSAPLEML